MTFYLIDDIEQGTKAWHEWRKGVIGASEAVVIMGENRWKGRQQLLNEKLGLATPFAGNSITREGNALEPLARAALEKKYKEKLTPTIVQDSNYPFLAASLDAINKDKNRVFEIKCGARTYEMLENSKNVPRYYVAQVQHMLMVTQMESLIFAAYRPYLPVISIEVFRNENYIKTLLVKEKNFIEELESRGHKIQNEFRGHFIGKLETNPISKKRSIQKYSDAEWRYEENLLKFWDGECYLIGNEPGLYEIAGTYHYWDGEEWWIPQEVGLYDLNGEEYYWNGDIWQ